MYGSAHRGRDWILGGAALTCLVSCTMVYAAEAEEATELEAIEVVGEGSNSGRIKPLTRSKVSNAPNSLPAAVTTITDEDIRTLNVDRDISNIYRRVPGVVANNIDQGDTGNGFRMRGFTTNGTHGADVAVYVDGVPQNIPSSQGGAGHGPVFLEWLTPQMIKRVDVIKGPISALYGDQNRAGAVNIETLDGGDVASSLGVDIASFDGRRTNLVLGGEHEGFESLFVVDIYKTNGYRKAAETNRDNYFWKLSKVFGDAKYSARFSHYESDFKNDGYLNLPALKAGTISRRDTDNLYGFGNANRNTYVFNRAPAEGDEGLYYTAYFEDFKRVRGISNGTNTHNYGKDDRDIYGGRLAYNFVYEDSASLMVGADVRRDKGDAYRQQYRNFEPTPNFYFDFDQDLITYGVFAQGQYKPVDSLKLLGGIRYDRFDYDIDNLKFRNADTGYHSSVTTPKLGLVWTPIEQFEVFTNASQGFRSPAAEYISSGSSGALPPSETGGRINGSVRPSKVTSYDIGFTVRPTERFSSTTEFYYIQNDSETLQTSPGVFEQVSDTTRKGVETSFNYQATSTVSTYASYGRIIDAVIDNPAAGTGDRLVVPEHTYKAGLQYQDAFMAGQLTLNADTYHLTGIPYYVGTEKREMPVYTRYDLRASYDYSDYQFSVYGTFQPHRYGTEVAYGTTSGLVIVPQPSTTLGASVRYFF
ncbi:outer membrane receptor protein involved in Fe transport [Pseudomonas sp. BIGb0408]|uniref:Outer membrane receptor protein involved in Fe transport n=1 Tax=Phytopseudomonas flavescens TaxID=29435 RepID=A0A7Y9XKR6_9GAMM|nr:MULTISPECIES: TonB-dependent receptor [Pseudomonas]MCW2292351.1 outer membrane receptor protein involved in Fe transport [Pseudomonas sp. BIGb0408]NYH73077.1 outer membrane receptor protein involved in Fe transport [Pseudomonas flavescens]